MDTAQAKPVTVRMIALGVAWGLLVVLAIVWFVYRMSQPSETDCIMQRLDYRQGELSAYEVDDACR